MNEECCTGLSVHSAGAFELAFENVAHELGLQALRTEFPTNVQRTLPRRHFVVPCAQVQHRPIEFSKRSPHQPPAVGGALEHPAVGARAAVERQI